MTGIRPDAEKIYGNTERTGCGPVRKGADNGMAKLTARRVASIRRRVGAGVDPSRIADEFGVHRETVMDVVRRKTWKHVE